MCSGYVFGMRPDIIVKIWHVSQIRRNIQFAENGYFQPHVGNFAKMRLENHVLQCYLICRELLSNLI